MIESAVGLFVLILPVVAVLCLIFLFRKSKQANEESDRVFEANLTSLSDGSKASYVLTYNARKKSAVVALLLAIFLGGIGGHKFYLGNLVLGVLYLVFCWTGIPSIVALVEAFTVADTVRTINKISADELMIIVEGSPPDQS
jgi:TM2 domain-containing membrane protein YozV